MHRGKRDPKGKSNLQYLKRKWLLAALIVVILVSALLAFQYTRSKPSVETITLGTSASLTSTLLMIAKEKKLFEKFSLKVDLKYFSSAGKGLNAMLNDQISVSAVAETPIMFSGLKRDDFRVFATILSNSNDPKIVVRSDAVQNGPKSLTGKRIGTTKTGQSAHFFLYLFLLRHDIPMDTVTVVHDPPSAIVEMLSSGEIDAASLFEPYATFASERLKENGRVLAEPGLYSKTFNLVAKTSFLNNHREAVERLLRALIAAEIFCMGQPDQVEKIISKRLEVDGKLIRDYLKQSNFEVSLYPSLASTLKEEAQWAMRYGYASRGSMPDYTKFLFVDALKALRPESVPF
ncbi:MAG: ABC transporter substrate-binding protein [Desulfobacteraceae bacterium]|jgi:NitT/TauT family transport system substrate-binding protein